MSATPSLSPSGLAPLTPRLLLLLPALLLLLQQAAAAPRKEIPNFLHVCKRNDPHLEDCVINSIDKLRPKLLAGIPELSVQALEPLVIPELTFRPGPDLHAKGRDVQLLGGSGFKITSLRINVNDTALSFLADVYFPKVSFVCEYEMQGRVLALPISGKGLLTANATDISGTLYLLGDISKRKTSEYVRFHEGETKLKIDAPIVIHLDNLFNGDKTLGEVTNAALNENNDDLKLVVIPTLELAVTEVAIEIANKISMAYPLDQLFPRQ